MISLLAAKRLAVTVLKALDGHTKREALGALTVALGSILLQTAPGRAGREELARRVFNTLMNLIDHQERSDRQPRH